MKNQKAYRYCLSWLLVAMSLCRGPAVCVLALWFAAQPDTELVVVKAIAPLVGAAMSVFK